MFGQIVETRKIGLAEFTAHACRVLFVNRALANGTAEPAEVAWLRGS